MSGALDFIVVQCQFVICKHESVSWKGFKLTPSYLKYFEVFRWSLRKKLFCKQINYYHFLLYITLSYILRYNHIDIFGCLSDSDLSLYIYTIILIYLSMPLALSYRSFTRSRYHCLVLCISKKSPQYVHLCTVYPAQNEISH